MVAHADISFQTNLFTMKLFIPAQQRTEYYPETILKWKSHAQYFKLPEFFLFWGYLKHGILIHCLLILVKKEYIPELDLVNSFSGCDSITYYLIV